MLLNPILLTRSEIDSLRWDACIAQSQHSVIYSMSWYLDIVCEDWHAWVWPSAQDLQIVMPLPVKFKYGIPILYQPHFCQYLGIFSQKALNQAEVFAFLQATSVQFSYISLYRFHPAQYQLVQSVLDGLPEIQYNIHKTVWLSLKYFRKTTVYSRDRRANLAKSKKWGWYVKEGESIEPLIDLFRQYHATDIEGGVHENSYSILARIHRESLLRQKADLSYAYREGVLHAGVLLLKEGDLTIYTFNAADSTGRKGNARTLLLHRYFEENAGSDLTFDFESPEVESIHRFYKSFGGKEMKMLAMHKKKLKFPLREIQMIRHILIRAKRGLFAVLCTI